ncbi:hypothetical protein, partial [Neisseria sp. HMSC066B07]|uniref:hypothetical protein n=1 Tax=Neisseria sp. HMSC066B07 TaxID=1739476 RepID=UPI000A7FABDE
MTDADFSHQLLDAVRRAGARLNSDTATTTPAADDAPQQGKPLHILLAMCYLLHRTGAEMFTRDLAMWLRRRGHAVTIFATAFGD